MRNEECDSDIVDGKKEFKGNPYMRPQTKKEQKEALEAFKKLEEERS